MRLKKGLCLLTALVISMSSVCYAEDINNYEGYQETESEIGQGTETETGQGAETETGQDAEAGTGQAADTETGQEAGADTGQDTGADTGGDAGAAAGQANAGNTDQEDSVNTDGSPEQENGEITEQDEDNYVIWGRGKGITPETIESDNDQFSTLPSGMVIVDIESELKKKIEAYKKAESIDFGEWVGSGQLKDTKTAYYEYENGMIFTSDAGIYSVCMPILNTFISSGGVQSLGAPIEEQKIKGSSATQKFEKGTLTSEVQKSPDTLVVRRNNIYHFKYTMSNGVADEVVAYGKAQDDVLIGDWNGDGKDTLCVRRGNTYYFKNSIATGVADYEVKYGRQGDKVIVGDWDGDGKDTLCVRRGKYYYFKDSIASGEADYVIGYGRSGDNVLIGDWDNDGKDTLCVRRQNTYYFKNSITGGIADSEIHYGKSSDDVMSGDWDGDGYDTLCVRRGNAYYIKNSINGGEADKTVLYGRRGDVTYAGSWSSVPKVETSNAEDISFNTSHGFEYSQLTQAFADNSVNSASFRKSAITTHIDEGGNQVQYCAYYDYYGAIVIAKRVNSGNWEYQWTDFKGNIKDAHNVVSLAVDGAGYLHMAWSQHSGALMYAKSTAAGSMDMSEMQMIGNLEDRVTYPEFYVQPSGDLFFLYRNGSSGNGNIVLNRYSQAAGTWKRVHDNLISGEGQRSPYWQASVDSTGRLHISWVWRETADVTTNYNMSYTVSTDSSGSTFVNSLGAAQILPLTESSAEVICEIPQNSALINQTSMATDGEDKPYIISYWRVDGVVQYNIIRFTGTQWIIYNTDIRKSDFDLSGTGTRALPCGRPQILVDGIGEEADIYVLFRDDERNGKATIAKLGIQDVEIITEKMIDITDSALGEWEPNYDIALWNKNKELEIFMQKEYYNVDGGAKKHLMENIYVVDVTSMLSE